MYVPFKKGNKFASNEYRSKLKNGNGDSEHDDVSEPHSKIKKDVFKYNNVLDAVSYMQSLEIDGRIQNTIVAEFLRRQLGVITRDEQEIMKEQFRVVLDFIKNKGMFPEFFAFCEESVSGYLPILDEK